MSDINKGPIERAKQNIEKYGLCDRLKAVHTAGLDGIEKSMATDIVICGMGGELIVKIIENSEYSKKQGIRLILQPMTHVALVRKYLQNGYFTVAENVVCEDGKIYQVICAEYDGEQHDFPEKLCVFF